LTLPSDHQARQKALNTQQSFAVSAPAGSGKTELLTQRVLALLAVCDEPENILAITFTRKAASEMQHRIIQALHNAQHLDPDSLEEHQRKTWSLAKKVLQRNEERQWQILDCPNRLRITTIDSFCRSISQQMPYYNQFGPLVDIVDDPQVLYEAAAKETLSMVNETGELKDHLTKIIKHFDNNLLVIESLFKGLLSKRDQWLSLLFQIDDQRGWLENILQTTINTHLQELAEALSPIASDLVLLSDYAASNIDESNSNIKNCLGLKGLPDTHFSKLTQWLGLVELLLTKEGKWRKNVNVKLGFLSPSNTSLEKDIRTLAKANKEKMESLLNDCKDKHELLEILASTPYLPSTSYDEQQWQLLESLTLVLKVLVGNLLVIFHQQGKTDYQQVSLSALNALGDDENPTDLSLYLDYKIQHILVDEFQDTSSTQLSLLKKITYGWQKNDGRTLFTVGDAMQSCYRFRDANVGIFLEIRKHGLGDISLEPLDLQTNFRSRSDIVDWVNQTFSRIFPSIDNTTYGAVSYQNSNSIKPNTQGAAVQTMLFAHAEKLNNRDAEARKVCEIIQSHQDSNPQASIAVLVRKKDDIRTIIKTLQKENINYEAIEMDRLSNNMGIVDLLSLTKALLFPHDRISWLAILRAPWCALDMNDLHSVANYKIELSSNQLLLHSIQDKGVEQHLSPLGFTKLQRFVNIITNVLKQRFRLPLRRWVQSAWLALGGTATLLDSDDGIIVENYFQLLDQYDFGGSIENFQEFENALGRLFAKPKPKGSNPIQLMTIHKSKGLEFDTVIIPSLDKQQRRADKELLLWLEKVHYNKKLDTTEAQLLISPTHATGQEQDPIFEHIQKQNQHKDSLESDRLLYVACTRAINHLYLLGNVSIENKTDTLQPSDVIQFTDLKPPSSSSFLSSLWPQLEKQESLFIQNCLSENDEKANTTPLTHPNYIASIESTWQTPPLPVSDLLKKYRGSNQLSELSDNVAKPDALINRESRYLGSVIHLVLQKMVYTDMSIWSKSYITDEKQLWQVQLLQLGMSEEKCDWAIHRIEECVNTILKDKTAHWLLDNGHKDSQTEFSLWYRGRQYIIDRTFIDHSQNTDTRWIVDYKSSTPETGQNIESFLAHETETYHHQLENYARLFKEESLPIKLALYFPLLGILHTLPTDIT
jgi:ATP-dependent exoDNAse (exonuclease V) beta subunit